MQFYLDMHTALLKMQVCNLGTNKEMPAVRDTETVEHIPCVGLVQLTARLVVFPVSALLSLAGGLGTTNKLQNHHKASIYQLHEVINSHIPVKNLAWVGSLETFPT